MEATRSFLRPHSPHPHRARRDDAPPTDRPAAHTETLFYHLETGWSGPLPALDSEQTLVMVFGAGELGGVATPLKDLVTAYPKSQLVGCSRPAEVSQDALDTVSVTVLRFSHTYLSTACVPASPPADAYALGRAVAGELLAPGLRSVMLFSAPEGGGELRRGVKAVLPRAVTLTGHFVGSGGPRQGWVVGWGRPQRSVVAAVGFYGELYNGLCDSVAGPNEALREVLRGEENTLGR